MTLALRTIFCSGFVLGTAEREGSMADRPEDSNKTIYSESIIGKRLSKVRNPGTMFIVFQGKSVPIASRITVGRETDNTIVVEDALASRHHAVIQKVKDAYFVEDLGSTNGTYVNGASVPAGKYVRLNQDDVILIGRSELSLKLLP